MTEKVPLRRILAGLFAASILLAACSSDGDGNGSTSVTGTTGETGSTGGGTTITIESTASGFEPKTLIVSGPTEVTVTNNDSVAHTFTMDDDSASELLAGGDTVSVNVDVSETTGFHCSIHPEMTGTIEVA